MAEYGGAEAPPRAPASQRGPGQEDTPEPAVQVWFLPSGRLTVSASGGLRFVGGASAECQLDPNDLVLLLAFVASMIFCPAVLSVIGGGGSRTSP